MTTLDLPRAAATELGLDVGLEEAEAFRLGSAEAARFWTFMEDPAQRYEAAFNIGSRQIQDIAAHQAYREQLGIKQELSREPHVQLHVGRITLYGMACHGPDGRLLLARYRAHNWGSLANVPMSISG